MVGWSEQVELARGAVRATVVGLGGGLRRLAVDGDELLDPYPASALPDGARGQLLLPWPNRLPAGRFGWRGAELTLPVDDPATGSAIHGLARWAYWTPTERSAGRARLEHALAPRPGWPFLLTLSVTYRLLTDGVAVVVGARNDGPGEAPFGAGAHPYLRAGTAVVDQARLSVPAEAYLTLDAAGQPVAEVPVAGTDRDFRTPTLLGERRLDDCFTGLTRDPDGWARARLAGPQFGVELAVGPGWDYLMAYTGDTLADPARRRQGLALEPMTCPPGALATGTGVVVLPEKGYWEGEFRLCKSP